MELVRRIAAVPIAAATLTLLSRLKGFAYTLKESFHETLSREGAVKLSVSNRNGSIEVSPWQEEEIKIEATKQIKAADKRKAKEYAGKLKIEIFREGREIIVRTIRPEPVKGGVSGVSSGSGISLKGRSRRRLTLTSVSRNGLSSTSGAATGASKPAAYREI